VTAHARAGEELELDWQGLADPQATLSIYMGKAAAPLISAKLIAAGLPADTPVVLIESASLPEERQFATRLDLLPLATRVALTDGPALMLVGKALNYPSKEPARRLPAAISAARLAHRQA
jgi:uroporphyrin-III C-methyltransferase